MTFPSKKVVAALVVVAAAIGYASAPAGAVIHEIVAAYCSVGDVGAIEGNALEPPALSDFSSPAFAKPVLASGAVSSDTFTTTDKRNLKVVEGLFAPTFELNSTTIEHESEHCKAMRP